MKWRYVSCGRCMSLKASKLTAYKKIFNTSTGYVKTMKITK